MSFSDLPQVLQEEIAEIANLDIPHIIREDTLQTYYGRAFQNWVAIYEAPSAARWQIHQTFSYIKYARGHIESPYRAEDVQYMAHRQIPYLQQEIFYEERENDLEILTYCDEWDYTILHLTDTCQRTRRRIMRLHGKLLHLWINNEY